MATWKVSAERIRLFPHPKADRLQLAKAGMFQLVVNTANGREVAEAVWGYERCSPLTSAATT